MLPKCLNAQDPKLSHGSQCDICCRTEQVFLFAIKNRDNRQKTVGIESTGRIFSENTRILLSAENAYFSLQGRDDER